MCEQKRKLRNLDRHRVSQPAKRGSGCVAVQQSAASLERFCVDDEICNAASVDCEKGKKKMERKGKKQKKNIKQKSKHKVSTQFEGSNVNGSAVSLVLALWSHLPWAGGCSLARPSRCPTSSSLSNRHFLSHRPRLRTDTATAHAYASTQ